MRKNLSLQGANSSHVARQSAQLRTLNIVIPMKSAARAKQRLNHVLSPAQRQALAWTLYTNTLQFVRQHYPDTSLLVVTDDAHIAAFAAQFGAAVLRESTPDLGLNAALQQATHWSLAHGFSHQLIIPADIGELDKAELDCVLEAGFSGMEVVIATAKDQGTNALLTSPPDAIAPCFGEQSARQHQQLAAKRQRRVARLTLDKLSLDIDVSADLERCAALKPTQECCHG